MHASIILLIILLCASLISLFLYRFQGRKDLIRLDSVQFAYLFIYAPFLFVWLKSFVFVQLRAELGSALSTTEYFIVDTIVSVIGLYLYGIVAMKALTKTLYLKRFKDPLADLFQHTEYIHLWFSHLIMFVGVGLMMLVLSGINLLIPFEVPESKFFSMIMILMGIIFGMCWYIILLLSNPKQEHYRLLKVVKLIYGFYFSVFVSIYFVINPNLEAKFSFYWFSFFLFATFVVFSFSSYRSSKANTLLERITDIFRDHSWGNNITLLKPTKK